MPNHSPSSALHSSLSSLRYWTRFVLVAMLVASGVRAQGASPSTGGGIVDDYMSKTTINVALLAGAASERFGPAFGARVGYLLFDRVYVGGALNVHLPEGGGASLPATLQLGVDIPVGPLRLRPGVAGGFSLQFGTGYPERGYGIFQASAELYYLVPQTDLFFGMDPARIQVPLVGGLHVSWSGYVVGGVRFGH